MFNPLLACRRFATVAAVFAVAALGVGTSGRGNAVVTEEQAEAVVTAAIGETVITRPIEANSRVVEAVVFSKPDETPAWFPALAADVNHHNDLALRPSPMQMTAFAPGQFEDTAMGAEKHTAIPLPPAAWTGLAGLGAMATIGGRRAIARFFT